MLCGCSTNIKSSHIVPKFAIGWIKRTSPTGYLRRVVNPNVRVQDGAKLELLCKNCEILFSKLEKKFAEKIFIPYLEEYEQSFNCEDWLLPFAVSLAWRTIVVTKERWYKANPKLVKYIREALNCWRNYLLNGGEPGGYEHHILFLDMIKGVEGFNVPEKFDYYILRGIDSTIAFSRSTVFAYTKLPGIIFWTGIHPQKLDGWGNTLILENGVVNLPQRVDDGNFGKFLLDRARQVGDMMSSISKAQVDKLSVDALKDPKRLVTSKAFDIEWYKRYGRYL